MGLVNNPIIIIVDLYIFIYLFIYLFIYSNSNISNPSGGSETDASSPKQGTLLYLYP